MGCGVAAVNALDRKTIGIAVNVAEYLELEALAKQAGLSIPQYVRTRCGFQVRQTSKPGTDERGDEEDDAWERLVRLGLNPEDYFPPET
jgi:hypothetical protein